VGREDELAALNRLLDDETIRLITIHGAGGMGKTRLALELAARQRGRFANGVYFVPLAIANEEDSIVAAVASAINYALPPIGDNKEGLLSYLHTRKSMLLVMDNLEQVGGGALLISDILNAAPAVKILATSREKLNLSGEVVFKLGGMEIPGRESLEEAVEYDAIKLFIQSARRAQPDFKLRPKDLSAVLRICRRVLGMPLGIVLAAAWVEILSLEEIAEEIDQSLDFLEADIRDMPERHRSIRAVFESTWVQLSDIERSVYMKLAIFRGGVKRQIAQYVTGASLSTLTALVNKSLLRRNPDSGRYEVHELLREYAEEKLEQAGEAQAARDIHSHCYLSFLCQRDSDLRGFRQLAAMKEIEGDFENVRAAWTWRVRKNDHEMIAMALESLFLFCSMQGFFEPGEELFKQALAQFSPKRGEEPSLLWARLLMRRELLLDPHPDVQAQVEYGLALAKGYQDQAEIAFGLRALGYALSSQGDFAGAIPILAESLLYYRALQDHFNTERVLSDLGLFCGVIGERDQSLAYFQEALNIQREIGDDVGITHLVIRNGINVAAGDRFRPISKLPDI
jgi:predicted ATPase